MFDTSILDGSTPTALIESAFITLALTVGGYSPEDTDELTTALYLSVDLSADLADRDVAAQTVNSVLQRALGVTNLLEVSRPTDEQDAGVNDVESLPTPGVIDLGPGEHPSWATDAAFVANLREQMAARSGCDIATVVLFTGYEPLDRREFADHGLDYDAFVTGRTASAPTSAPAEPVITEEEQAIARAASWLRSHFGEFVRPANDGEGREAA